MKKKLSWYVVIEDEWCYVIGASSYSKAKICVGTYVTGNLSAWESLNSLTCRKIKEKLSIEPIKDCEMFEDRGSPKELLELGVYHYCEDMECPSCGNGGTVYYDGYFFCDNCPEEKN